MKIKLSNDTQATLLEVLGVAKLEEVLEKSYRDITREHDVNRDTVGVYADRNRGSVRINAGKFYTTQEFDERINRVTSIKLP